MGCVCTHLLVLGGVVFVWWRDTRTAKYQQCNYTPDMLSGSTCASLPSSLHCRPSPLIGPWGPCACVWGEVSIRVITPGPVQLTPTPTDPPPLISHRAARLPPSASTCSFSWSSQSLLSPTITRLVVHRLQLVSLPAHRIRHELTARSDPTAKSQLYSWVKKKIKQSH